MFFKILFFPFKLLSWIYGLLVKFWRLYVMLNVLAVVLIVLAVWGFNFWFPKTAEVYVKHRTNFPLSIAQSNCSLLSGSFDFKGIDLKNPKEKFKQEYCVQLNQVAVDIDWISLLQAKLNAKQVILDINKIVCEKNANNEYNFETLFKSLSNGKRNTTKSQIPEKRKVSNLAQKETKIAVSAPASSKGSTAGKSEGSDSQKPANQKFIVNDADSCVMVKSLKIRLGSCELHNVTPKGNDVININKTWEFHDVTSGDQIINTIVRDLQGLGVSFVVKSVLGCIFDLPVLNTVTDSIEKVHEAGKEMIKGVTSSIKEMIPAKEVLGNSLDQLKNAFSGSNTEQLDPSKVNSDINDLIRSRRR